jgi:hypothetical protein
VQQQFPCVLPADVPILEVEKSKIWKAFANRRNPNGKLLVGVEDMFVYNVRF